MSLVDGIDWSQILGLVTAQAFKAGFQHFCSMGTHTSRRVLDAKDYQDRKPRSLTIRAWIRNDGHCSKECIWTEDDTGHPKGVELSKQQNLAGNGVNSCGR